MNFRSNKIKFRYSKTRKISKKQVMIQFYIILKFLKLLKYLNKSDVIIIMILNQLTEKITFN